MNSGIFCHTNFLAILALSSSFSFLLYHPHESGNPLSVIPDPIGNPPFLSFLPSTCHPFALFVMPSVSEASSFLVLPECIYREPRATFILSLFQNLISVIPFLSFPRKRESIICHSRPDRESTCHSEGA